ncbi:hypothetical protein GCM10010329_11880 [Streptomyces spiroverticillatus]|uniref:Uncharacterized protein n=1 Tax=Streptomyces finlayi TaxID=67296 RepID=A0A918WXK9_9ACTN|nr:hypothetical protein [Streptomyces finlayi]GGZ92734.1 hypothetical protein GCM10010329_11880 [Streptomyces spiroverticillatus]GHC92830.1 hypothetical protein GCM10010334_29220 [Streptomyces finlayi]
MDAHAKANKSASASAIASLDYEELEAALDRRHTVLLRDRARAALVEIATGERELPAVRHPLGFLCLPLLREGPRGVCVHLFEEGAGPEPGISPLHSHSWDLHSHVLYGQVANLLVHTEDGGDRPTHRVFEVRSDPDGTDEILPTDEVVRSAPGPRRVSSGGESYTLSAGRFHATVVEDGQPAATLVLGLVRPGRLDRSLGPLDGRATRSSRRLCDARQTARTVSTALGRMDRRGP